MAKVIKVVFFGPTESGKSALAKSFNNPEHEFSDVYQKTNGVELFSKKYSTDDFELQCWDCSGEKQYKQTILPYQRGAKIGVYCVDLTKPLNVRQIESDIASFEEKSPKGSLVIVGTKSDYAGAFIEDFKELQYSNSFIVSSKTKEGTPELFTNLHHLSKQYRGDPNATAIDEALMAIDSASLLYDSLYNLKNKMALLASDKRDLVGQEAKKLVANLNNPFANPATVINDFEINCYSYLSSDNSVFKAATKAIAVVAITALVTVLAALVGFGIGFAVGVWTGPGAFISGILSGSTAAFMVVGASGVLGVTAGALIANSLFEATPIEEAVHEVAESARNTPFIPRYS